MRTSYTHTLKPMLRQARTGHLFFFLALAAIAFTITGPGLKLLRPAKAETSYFVRTDGSDTTCNGTADASAASAPNCAFKTIQKAVDTATDGDTINIAAGNYVEQVRIGKGLTLTGAGAGSTFIKPPATFPATSLGGGFIVEINNSATVNMSALTVAGPKVGSLTCEPAQSLDYGITIIEDATLFLSNASVLDIRDNPLSGCQTGIAIRAGSSSFEQNGNLALNNVTISGYQKGGVIVSNFGSTGSITNTTITGAGNTTATAQNGIQINDGANVSVDSSTIQGNRCDAPSCGPGPNDYASAGILVFDQGAGTTITNSTIQGNDVGILYFTYNSATVTNPLLVSGNNILSNRFQGIFTSAGTVSLTSNTIDGGGIAGSIGVYAYAYPESEVVPEHASTVDKRRRAPGPKRVADTVLFDDLTSNLITRNTTGIQVEDGSTADAVEPTIQGSCNRIVANGAGLKNLTQITQLVENNWWGCNAGPGGAGCDTVTGPADFNPWLVLTLTANPTTLATGQTSLLTASLNTNSAGEPAPCSVPNGTPVAFSSTCGPVNPAATATGSGEANSTLTAGAPGSCAASTRIDNQTVSVPITITAIQPGTSGTTTGAIVDPFGCTGPGDVLNVTLVITSVGGAQSFTSTSALPGGLALAGNFTSSLPGVVSVSGSGQTVTATTLPGQTLAAGQSVTIRYQVQVGDVPPGTVLLITTVTNFSGGATITSTAAAPAINCVPVGPGSLYPSTSEVSDQKAGSVLIYNYYTSDVVTPAVNTRITVTNTNPSQPIAVHLFFVDGATCSVADAFLCLTQNQTVSLLASDYDPGTSGYVIAVASSLTTGCPVNFNFLIGDEFVKTAGGFQANLGAEAIAALAGGLTGCDATTSTATLNFDGVSYNRLPRVLAADNLADNASGNQTQLVINRIGGDLATGASRLGTLFGLLYDDIEQSYSFQIPGGTCQVRGTISGTFPRTVPRVEQIIPAGRSGWLKLNDNSGGAILGAQLVNNANLAATANAFRGGHNLHKLTLAPTASITIPIFAPNCRF